MFVHTLHMTRSLRLLLGALAVVALLAIGTGLALATGGHQASPPATAAASHGDDGAENSTGDENEQEPAETGDDSSGGAGSATGAAGNHGAVVSKVARETPPGPDHGKIVSAVARANHGAAQRAAHATALRLVILVGRPAGRSLEWGTLRIRAAAGIVGSEVPTPGAA